MEKIFALFVAALVCASCCRDASAGWVRMSHSTIRLDGDIGGKSYDQYVEAARGGFSRVVLNSSGGYPSVALKIAMDIQNRGDVDIYVSGVCISACASYLAISGRSLHIGCNSVVAWHGGLGTSAEEMRAMQAEGVPSGLVAKYGDWLRMFHAREHVFYRKAGVDIQLLKDSMTAVGGLKLAESYDLDELTGEYSYSASAGIWVPSMESLRKYGFDHLKYCKDHTAHEIKSILKKKKYNVKFSTDRFR